MISIGIFAGVLILSGLTVKVIRAIAESHHILDVANERSSHVGSVPRGGGLAIVILTLAGVWLYVAANPQIAWSALFAYTLGAALIISISWIDDLRSQPAWLRLLVHEIAASIATYKFGYLNVNGSVVFNGSLAGWLALIITFMWIVGLTNAYNFMDGIDGIAGGQAVVAALCWAATGFLMQQPFVTILGLLLAASSLGFLFYNWSPARIFMGDVGSAFLGYNFAVLPLIFVWNYQGARSPELLFIGLLPVWPFVFDSSFTVLRRLYHHENVFSAHRSHLYQRLVITGYSHQLVSLLYTGLAVLGTVLALGFIVRVPSITVVTPILLVVTSASLWAFVTHRERRQVRRENI